MQCMMYSISVSSARNRKVQILIPYTDRCFGLGWCWLVDVQDVAFKSVAVEAMKPIHAWLLRSMNSRTDRCVDNNIAKNT